VIVCQRLAAGQWFSPSTQDSSVNKTDRRDITEILLKVVFNTTTPQTLSKIFQLYQGKNMLFFL